jgi:hypothetical protein
MAQRVLRPLVRPDTVKMWASSPYGFAAAWHAIRTGPDIVSVINWYYEWLPFQVCLVRAMQSVWRIVPEARLLLAGGVAEQSRESGRFLSVALDALSPDERSRIIMTGRFPDQDKAALFDALDVFAMPSLAESFGIVYLEAWMCRKPVIASRLGATEFVIDDGVDGDLVSPGDAGELAAAIVRLLGDRDRRQRFGAPGYAKTLARFTWDRVTDAVEHLYGHACEGADPRPVAATDASVVTVKSHEPI